MKRSGIVIAVFIVLALITVSAQAAGKGDMDSLPGHVKTLK